jgi:hypothetical protein
LPLTVILPIYRNHAIAAIQDAGLDELRAKTAAKFHDDFGDEAATAADSLSGKKQRIESEDEAEPEQPKKKRKKRKPTAG